MKNRIKIACILLFVMVSCLFSSCVDHMDDPIPVDPILKDFSIVFAGKNYYPADTLHNSYFVIVPESATVENLVSCFDSQGLKVQVDNNNQESGVTANDYSKIDEGVTFTITSKEGGANSDYQVIVLNTQLPVVFVKVDDLEEIKDKVNWKKASIKVYENGKIAYNSWTGIRGRGNATWTEYPKKPYNLKLENKDGLLGMKKHKRWCLLALYRGIIGNDLMFECSRRAKALQFVPDGKFVELILNGKFMGLYYLCEQITIDKNRINISTLKPEQTSYPEISGGFLLEYDELFDEEYKFTSPVCGYPVNIKKPDDDVPEEQVNYVKSYIHKLEDELTKIEKGEDSNYQDYLDVESFADYMLVLGAVGNYEAYKPRSVFMYKGRDGVDSPVGTVCKLKAGPLWDQEIFNNHTTWFYWGENSNALYYKYLFRDASFIKVLKERWSPYKQSILGLNGDQSILEYLNSTVNQISYSAKRDLDYWKNESFVFEKEVNRVMDTFTETINWMDNQIMSY